MGGTSSSSIYNSTDIESYISQQYSGTCDISCQNVEKDVNISVINSNVPGGIKISQQCSVDGSCYMGSNLDAVSDVLAKATNAASADAASGFLGDLVHNYNSNITNRTEIRTGISQAVSNSCNISSTNDLENVNIYAANSNLGGGIVIDQESDSKGRCAFNNAMQATAKATAIADNKASSGKDKYGYKSQKIEAIVSIVAAVVVLLIIFIIAKLFTRKNTEADDKNKPTQSGMPYYVPFPMQYAPTPYPPMPYPEYISSTPTSLPPAVPLPSATPSK